MKRNAADGHFTKPSRLKQGGTGMRSKNVIKRFLIAIAAVMILSGLSSQVMAQEKLKGKTVNINKATVQEFQQVPLITKDLAEKIVKYREKNGDFQVLEELLQVDGFSRDLLRKIKGFLLLEGIGGEECTC
jgi:competence ComEA-like helix-hairpin-helix protein